MEETVEELVTKHTRRELEEMAVALGIQSLGGTKAQLAESIIEARKRAQEQAAAGKPEERAEPAETMPSEAKKEMPSKPSEVKPEAPEKPLGRGVLAKEEEIRRKSGELKRAGAAIREEGVGRMSKSVSALKKAIDEQVSENKKGVAKIRTGVRQMKLSINKSADEFRKSGERIREEGTKELNEGLKIFRADLDKQIKENREAISRMGSGAAEIRQAMDRMSIEFRNSGSRIREEGTKELNEGLKIFRADLDKQIKENREAASRLSAGARELHARAISFRDGVCRYAEQDVGKYIREFYYG